MHLTTSTLGRRGFLGSLSLAFAGSFLAMPRVSRAASSTVSSLDAQRMRTLADWAMQTMSTPNPVPYAAEIFDSKSDASLMRATNAVGPENDPSAHGEVRTIRLACKKLGRSSLRGYTLYTTCEPCAMCMGCCLWAGLDRVVYGATIEDAARFGREIMIPSAEVQKRSDMPCIVDGPVERERCLLLFTNPNMQRVFKQWRDAKD